MPVKERTLTQKNILLLKALVLLKVTGFLLRQYLLLPLCQGEHFRFFADIYARSFGLKMMRLSPNIPYIDLEQKFPGIGEVMINTIGRFDSFRNFEFSTDRGALVSPAELQTLCALVKYIKPQTILEIGTHRGWTIANLALNAPLGCQIVTIDIAPLRPDCPQIEEVIAKIPIQFIHADSVRFDFSPYKGSTDFVFIDGSHHEADIEIDSRSALAMLSPRGIIVWHDHNLKFSGVVNCLHRLSREIEIFHVPGTALAYTTGVRIA